MSQWSRWSTSTDAPSSCGRGGVHAWTKRGVPTQLDDHSLLLQDRRYLESRDLRWTKYAGAVQAASSRATADGFWVYSSTQCDEGRPHGPRVWLRWWKLHGLASATCCSCIFCSVFSLASLRGVRRCGGRHGLGSPVDLLGLIVFSFLFWGFV